MLIYAYIMYIAKIAGGKVTQSKRPYEWARTEIMLRADKHVQTQCGKFSDRMEFLNGVRYVLDYLDQHELLGVLSESLQDRLPRGKS